MQSIIDRIKQNWTSFTNSYEFEHYLLNLTKEHPYFAIGHLIDYLQTPDYDFTKSLKKEKAQLFFDSNLSFLNAEKELRKYLKEVPSSVNNNIPVYEKTEPQIIEEKYNLNSEPLIETNTEAIDIASDTKNVIENNLTAESLGIELPDFTKDNTIVDLSNNADEYNKQIINETNILNQNAAQTAESLGIKLPDFTADVEATNKNINIETTEVATTAEDLGIKLPDFTIDTSTESENLNTYDGQLNDNAITHIEKQEPYRLDEEVSEENISSIETSFDSHNPLSQTEKDIHQELAETIALRKRQLEEFELYNELNKDDKPEEHVSHPESNTAQIETELEHKPEVIETIEINENNNPENNQTKIEEENIEENKILNPSNEFENAVSLNADNIKEDTPKETIEVIKVEHKNEEIAEEKPIETSVHNVLTNSEETKSGSIISLVDDKEQTISFEPLHISDYFAATGVKIPKDVIENEPVLRKAHKFTEWLRLMKSIDPNKGLDSFKPEQEAEIKSIAEKSNIDNEVLTEAMAEIFVKQGKLSKAKALYIKLSLLNPQKSSYFAAKIEQIGR